MNRVLALLAVLLSPALAPAAEFRTGQVVMGTVLQVTVVDPDAGRAKRLAGAAIDAARRWDDILTVWRPEGELARLNARAGTGPVRVGEDLAAALGSMRLLSRATAGAFDPAVGRLVDLWRTADGARGGAVQRRTIEDVLTLSGTTATLGAGVSLDSGGIGKGIALDAAADGLRAAAVRAAFLDFGGSTQVAIGAPVDEPRGWKVALAGWGQGRVLGIQYLRDAALSTSRASGAGSEAGPVVDPRTGLPVAAHRLVTVRTRTATAADAWSTALVVRGRDGMAAAEAAGVQVLLEDEGGVVRTPGWEREPEAGRR